MYSIDAINVSTLSNKEITELFLFHKAVVQKYKLLDQYKDVEMFKTMYISSFNSIDNTLFTLKAATSIYGLIAFADTMDWNGNKEYRLNILLC